MPLGECELVSITFELAVFRIGLHPELFCECTNRFLVDAWRGEAIDGCWFTFWASEFCFYFDVSHDVSPFASSAILPCEPVGARDIYISPVEGFMITPVDGIIASDTGRNSDGVVACPERIGI